MLRRYMQDPWRSWPSPRLVVDLAGRRFATHPAARRSPRGWAPDGMPAAMGRRTGRVTGIEVLLPATTLLGRPAVAVTWRISGLSTTVPDPDRAGGCRRPGASRHCDEDASGENPLAAGDARCQIAAPARIFGSSPVAPMARADRGRVGAVRRRLEAPEKSSERPIIDSAPGGVYGGAEGRRHRNTRSPSQDRVAEADLLVLYAATTLARKILEGFRSTWRFVMRHRSRGRHGFGSNADVIVLDTTDPARSPGPRSVTEAGGARRARPAPLATSIFHWRADMRHYGPRGALAFAETVDSADRLRRDD